MKQKIKNISIGNCVIDKEGKRYLTLKQSCIPALFLLTDNITFTIWSGDKNIYIKIDEIIKWFEKELIENVGSNELKKVYKNNIKEMKEINLKPLNIPKKNLEKSE